MLLYHCMGRGWSVSLREIKEGLFEGVEDYLRREDKLPSVEKPGGKNNANSRCGWCKGPGVGRT